MNLSVGAKTDPGRRPNNEDHLAVVDVRRHRLRADGVLVVADGMGGRNFGERASAAAVETVQETLVEMLDADRAEAVNVSDALDSALRKANARVYEVAGASSESRGMGTTCVAAVVEGDRLFLAHAGDSRAYLMRGQHLLRLTDDHSYVAEQVRAGTLSEESARRSRFRNVITRAVGIEPTITPDLSEHDVQNGDWILLCTDGLSNMVAEPEIIQTLASAASVQDAADRLVQIASRNGGRDNITAITARLEAGNRTQRMRKIDLERVLDPTQSISAAPSSPVSEVVPPTAPTNGHHPAPDKTSVTSSAPPPAPNTFQPLSPSARAQFTVPPVTAAPPAPIRTSRGLIAAIYGLSLVALLLLAGIVFLAFRLAGIDGRLDLVPVKPSVRPLVPTPVANLQALAYGTPTLFSSVPIMGDVLTWSPGAKTLTALTVSGQVLRFNASGQTLSKFPFPPSADMSEKETPSHTEGHLAVPSAHWTVDQQGDLYVSDPLQKTIRKYGPHGQLLHVIGLDPDKQSLLTRPEAIAVSADGTLYVADAQRLKVIHPHMPPVASSFPVPISSSTPGT